MATTQTIDATIFASSHPDIAKRTSISGVLFSSFMLLVGILAFASTFELEDRSSTVSMALMVFGTGLFLVGIFRLFWKSKEVVYLPTGSIAKERSVFFDLINSSGSLPLGIVRTLTLSPEFLSIGIALAVAF